MKSKWIIALNIKCKPTKLLDKNIQKNIYNLKLGKEFSDITIESIIHKINN